MVAKKKARAVREIKEVLKRTAPEQVESVILEAAEEALNQAQERLDKEALPGQVVGGLKKPWTFAEMLKRFPVVNFIPEETIRLTWNGVSHQCYSGRESHIPKPFYDIYLRHKAETRKAGTAFPRDQGFDVSIGLGAGALPPA